LGISLRNANLIQELWKEILKRTCYRRLGWSYTLNANLLSVLYYLSFGFSIVSKFFLIGGEEGRKGRWLRERLVYQLYHSGILTSYHFVVLTFHISLVRLDDCFLLRNLSHKFVLLWLSSFVLDGSTSFCTHKLPKPIVPFHYDDLTLIQMEVHHFNLTYSTPKN
jgi:hypothetical protein